MKYKIKYILLVLLVSIGLGSLKAQKSVKTDSIKAKTQEKVNVLYGSQKYDRFVGNMNVVTGEKLKNYPALMINEALAGQLPGVFLRQNSGKPGDDNFSLNIRGTVGESNIILVDGVERELSPYDLDQIEDIKVLKDPISKALYGGRKSNGIIVVTTKRGKNVKSEFHINVQKGIKMPTVLPSYLNSYDFANAYNQAYKNDKGVDNPDLLVPNSKFSNAAMGAYLADSARLQYPNVDYYGQFLNKSMDITRVSAEYYGGNQITKYYVHGGFQKEGGLEAYAPKTRQNQSFNLQGNLETKFSEDIKLFANFTGYMANKEYPTSFNFSTLSNRYPNEYPIIVSGDSAGGTSTYKDNPYAALKQGGYTRENHIRMQSDLGFEFKLGKILKGLTLKPELSFDIYHKQNLSKNNTVGIYSIASYDLAGNPFGFNQIQAPVIAIGQSLGDNDYGQRWGATTTLAYERVFGKHAINVDVVYFLSKNIYAGDLQDYKRQNLGLRTNYTYAGKYTLEGVLNYTGSTSYEPNKRFKYFPAVGAGWLISNENFLKDVSAVNFLKLNASWGVMGNGDIAINQWRGAWGGGAGYLFSGTTYTGTTLVNSVYSSVLDWPQQTEIDINLEAKVFNGLSFKVSYFDYLEEGYLAKGTSVIPLIIGSQNYMPQINYGKTGMTGFEAEARYTGKVGNFKFDVGGHITSSKSKKVKIDEIIDPNYSTTGTPWDAIWGYQSVGKYTPDEISQLKSEIDAISAGTRTERTTLPLVSYMDPKALLAGNLKYADVNSDGVIDKYDTKIIGNNAPRMMYGGDVNLSYKGFNLYAMVLGYGKYNNLFNSSYYQVYSTRKYSTVVRDGLPNGNAYPMTTLTSGTNDFQTSDYWIADQSYLKLQNVAFSYTLPTKWVKSIKLSEVKLTLYGTDVMTFSKIKKSDPESLNAGVNDYPLFTTYAAGISISL